MLRRLSIILKSAEPSTISIYLLSVMYIIVFFYLSFMKYYTFNATFEDLGLYNQILWLLSHGGITFYNSSHFNLIYPINYQKPILFIVLLPLYMLYPHITLLFFIQSFFLGIAAIPLYYSARIKLRSGWVATIISSAYLFYYPLTSANLFDYHLMTFFPFFYFLMFFFYLKKNKKAMYASAILTSFINPLTLILVIFFLLYIIAFESNEKYLLKGRIVREFLKFMRLNMLNILIILFLTSLFMLYYLFGTLGGSPVTPSNHSIIQILLYSVNSKLMIILFLFGAVAFIPLYDLKAIFLLIPYIGWVFLSVNGANWTIFGLMYPILAAGPIFVGVIIVLTNIQHEEKIFIDLINNNKSKNKVFSFRNIHHTTSTSRRMLTALVFTTIVFSLIYFPLSPINNYVDGGLFNGNESLHTITTVTPQIKFLWKVINLIPSNASVLTQNNIPQLTGREYYQITDVYTSKIPYNYILLDTALTYFSNINQIESIAYNSIENHTFGVMAEGMGALLLKRGYNSTPLLYYPHSYVYNGKSLDVFSGNVVGTEIINDQRSYAMWYGPYITLFPGTYKCLFTLKSNLTLPKNSSALLIDVASGGGSVVYASNELYLGNFTAPNVFTTFTLTFTINKVIQTMEFRGMFPTGIATITLNNVTVTQIQ